MNDRAEEIADKILCESDGTVGPANVAKAAKMIHDYVKELQAEITRLKAELSTEKEYAAEGWRNQARQLAACEKAEAERDAVSKPRKVLTDEELS